MENQNTSIAPSNRKDPNANTLAHWYEIVGKNPSPNYDDENVWFKMMEWVATTNIFNNYNTYTIYLPNKITIESRNKSKKLPEFGADRKLIFAPEPGENYEGCNITLVSHDDDGNIYKGYENCRGGIQNGSNKPDSDYGMIFNNSVHFRNVNIDSSQDKGKGINLIKVRAGEAIFEGAGIEYFRDSTAITSSGASVVVKDINFKNAANAVCIRFYNTNKQNKPNLTVNGSCLFHVGQKTTCIQIGKTDRTSDKAEGNIGNISVDGNVADIGGSLIFINPEEKITFDNVNITNNSVSGAITMNNVDDMGVCVFIGGPDKTRYKTLNIVGNSFFLDGSKFEGNRNDVVAVLIGNRPSKTKVNLSGIFYINKGDKNDYPIIFPEDVNKKGKIRIAGVIATYKKGKIKNDLSGTNGIGVLQSNGKIERLGDGEVRRTEIFVNE